MIHSGKLDAEYDCLHKEAAGCLLLMQVGAFMRVMDDDARTVAAVCGIKLSMTGSPERPRVMGGFPCAGLDKYVGRLVRAGYSLAIAEQQEGAGREITSTLRLQVGSEGHGQI